ncbi:hypothetical protein B7760_01757 [Burkholderia glumae]|uniref:hypothetical protein n=1 Tax=Burkholderia glumae TaxID=337 RepID=UPI0020961CA7|nr:hypothetical protein [Burkholderia glumae]QKM47733.1 hypothetical protein B7760_01757 [Burkholderia glumae]
MSEIEFQYAPQGEKLEEYILSAAPRTIIRGPLGSGKTNASCWKGFRAMCAQAPDAAGIRRSRGIAVRNTYPDLLSTTVKDWLDMFEDLGRYVGGGMEPPTHYLSFELDDGTTVEAELLFIAFDRPEHVKKARGLQATWVWLNEVKELAKPVVDMLDLRVGRYPKDVPPTWYGMFGDTNSPDSDHWLYELAEEQNPRVGTSSRSRAASSATAIGGSSTRAPKTCTTCRPATTSAGCRARNTTGSRSIWRTNTGSWSTASRCIRTTPTRSTASHSN